MTQVVKPSLSNSNISATQTTYAYKGEQPKTELANKNTTYNMLDYENVSATNEPNLTNESVLTTLFESVGENTSALSGVIESNDEWYQGQPEVYVGTDGVGHVNYLGQGGQWVSAHVNAEFDGTTIDTYASFQLPEGAIAKEGGYIDKNGIFHSYQEIYDNVRWPEIEGTNEYVYMNGSIHSEPEHDGTLFSTVVPVEENGQLVEKRVSFSVPDGSKIVNKGYVDQYGAYHSFADRYKNATPSVSPARNYDENTGAVKSGEQVKSNVFSRAWEGIKNTGAKIGEKIKSIFSKDKGLKGSLEKRKVATDSTKPNSFNWSKPLEYSSKSPVEIHYIDEHGNKIVQQNAAVYLDAAGNEIGYRVNDVFRKTGKTVNGSIYTEAYYHYDRDTNSISPISVYNSGNQMLPDLRDKGSDKYNQHVEQLQKDYPISTFDNNVNDASDFYNNYMKAIDNSSQDYAALSESVFWHYTGREKEFQQTFGFPMYSVDENEGKVNFNYSDMEYSIFRYMNDEKIKDGLNSGKLYSDSYGIHNAKDGSLYDAGINEMDQKQMEGYLASYGVDAKVNLHSSGRADKYSAITSNGDSVILDAKRYKVYDQNGNERQIVNKHGVDSMTVLGVDEDGKLIVNRYGSIDKVDPNSLSSDIITIEYNN